MLRCDGQPLLVQSDARGRADKISVNAKRSEDGKSLVVQVVNWDDAPRRALIQVEGFSPSRPLAKVSQLSGAFDAANTAEAPDRVKPEQSDWRHEWNKGAATYTFAPRSFTVIRFE
jgi:alpha-L-arabinofuranosidase